jgi:hypothetical protein
MSTSRVDSRIRNAEADWARAEGLERKGLVLITIGGDPQAVRYGNELLRRALHLYDQALGLLNQLDSDGR